MIRFDILFSLAAEIHGGHDTIEAMLPNPASADELRALSDARYLAAMSRCVFQAGFVERIVNAKWSAIEQRFARFDPGAVSLLPDASLERFMHDAAVIRHRPKLQAVRDNAGFVLSIAKKHGSFGRFLADWPADDCVGLWQTLKKQGTRLGGNTGPRFLHTVGKDSFLLTGDVVAGLTAAGIIDGLAGSVRAKRAAQAAFEAWREESGRPLCQISMVLSLAAGGPIPRLPTAAECNS